MQTAQELDVNYMGADDTPWIPFTPLSDKVFLKYWKVDPVRGEIVVSMRFDDGLVLPTHYHTGMVIGHTVKGAWRYQENNWVSRTGDTVYEVAGSSHTPESLADNEVFFILVGELLFLDEDKKILWTGLVRRLFVCGPSVVDMAEQSAAVIPSHPPEPIMKLMNPLLRYGLRTPLGGNALKPFMVLNFSGRKTGRQFSIPVSAHVIDGQLYALANAGWKANFRGGGTADVLYNGKQTAMRGELIEDAAAVADLFHRCATDYGAAKAQRMMGLKFRDAGMPTLEQFRAAVAENKLVAIRFTPA